jgi:hypothetical protein
MRERCGSLVASTGLAAVLVLAGCHSESSGPNPSGELNERIAAALAVAGFTVATGGQGVSFFDNHVSCVQRGVATYVNDAAGRTVEFRGCEVLPGLVLDGAGHLEWSGDGLSPTRPEFCATDAASSCLTTFRWNGSIEVTVDEATVVTMDQFTVTSIVARQRASSPFAGLASWEVTANGQSFTGSDPDLFEAFIDTTGLALSNLPNPSGSLTALTEADLARLALGFGPEFGFDLIQETLAANVGDHTHHMPCGTATVTYDAERLPHVENEWSSCNFATMILDGSFRAEWGRFDVDSDPGALRMDLQGNFRLGGGVPEVELTTLRWTIEGIPADFPGNITVTLLLVGPSDQRTWRATIPVDD